MLDFDAYRAGTTSFNALVAGLGRADLRALTNEMIDRYLALLAKCDDTAVTFQPVDPEAHDEYAADEADVNLAWTLGHVIVHTTASSEESAALAAEMARGVVRSGRSRAEVPWQTVTTIAQCRARLEESRRMRLASLDMWPDTPHLDPIPRPGREPINAVGRFVLGLLHEHGHLGQTADIITQAGCSVPERVPIS